LEKTSKPVSLRTLILNRYVAWFFSIGYIVVHLATDIHHGGGLKQMSSPVRTFFIVSFVWIAWHVWVAVKAFGFPKQLKNMRDVYHWDAFAVLFITVPIFSVPAWGSSQILMFIAWFFFAPHLALNVWYLLSRSKVSFLRRNDFRMLATLSYLAIITYAAYHSFPTGHVH
jgi:hypothetical protein